ncbi:polysaccharide biosynthesis tyrosine autokinase [Sphingomonas sp. ASV193]|uniref:GumC family protein n=1 Tax=Sphingomonas sp. ASV193 TaxID=3144405 RepID=UPI0032E882A3
MNDYSSNLPAPMGSSAVPAPYPPPQAASPHMAQGSAPGGLDIAALLRIVREWRWLILAATVAGLALGVIASLLTTPLYRAFVTLEVNPPTVEVLDDKSAQPNSNTDSYSFLMTQIGLLSSHSLAERVAQDLNLASDPSIAGKGGNPASRLKAAADTVAGGIHVDVPENGQLIKFSYVAKSPENAARIANGIADGFIASGLQRRYEASDYARSFLEKQIGKTRNDLENSERALAAYAQQAGIIDVGSKDLLGGGTLQGQSLVELNTALGEATAKRIAAEGAYRAASLAASGSETVTGTAALRQQRALLVADYQQKSTLLKPDHPDMVSLKSQIDSIDKAIAQERSQVASGTTNTLAAAYRSALAAENDLRGKVAGLKDSVLDMRGRTVRYGTLQRDVDTNRSLYDALLQRYKNVGVGSGIGSSAVTIVDRADPPGAPYKPDFMRNLLMGLGVGLASGLILAVLLDMLSDTIKTREDVRTKLHVACLGVIPKSTAKVPMLEELGDQTSQVSESYAAVAAALRFSSADGAPKLIMVSSARAGEGKSSSALALSHNYARRGERVLLIDADLRRPAFANVSKSLGLIKLLTSHEPIRAHVAKTNFENLWLLPGGASAPNPADLLSTPRMGEILAEASQYYDRIVVDGPPLLGLADATLLAAAVRNVILIVESGKTRTRAAREAIERLTVTGARLAGVIVTKSLADASQYGYGYGYYTQAIEDRPDQIRLAQSVEPAEPSAAEEV